LANLSAIFGECVFHSEVNVKLPLKDTMFLKNITEPGRKAMKVLIENADSIDFLLHTPTRSRSTELKKSLSSKVKNYGSTLKRNFTVKRSNSEHSMEFRPPRLFENEVRVHLRPRKGTLALTSEEIINSRIRALQRKAIALEEEDSQKENTPLRINFPRSMCGEEPQDLEWKRLADSAPRTSTSPQGPRRPFVKNSTPLRANTLGR